LKLNLLKKLLSVTLITTLLFSFNIIPANANGYNLPQGKYNCNTGELELNQAVTSGYFTITSDEVEGFSRCVGAVLIPDGVQTIGEFAFEQNNITSVIIPNSVTIIRGDAFSGTTLLNSVTIPNSVTTISDYAFYESGLTSVTIGNQVATIGQAAFFNNTGLTSVTFLGNAPTTFDNAFLLLPAGATANVAFNATGFILDGGGLWKNLIVSYGDAPDGDSDDSGSPSLSVITPAIVEAPDVVFNLKNKKYLSKYAMKIKLRKNRSFKRNPDDLYKYEIFKTSKKTCTIIGNYVTRLKKMGTCDFYATRTTAKGKKYKYWVQINYTN
jgi:hypothetical protein